MAGQEVDQQLRSSRGLWGDPLASVVDAINAHHPRGMPGGHWLDGAGLEGRLKKPLAAVRAAPFDLEVAEPQRPQSKAEGITTAAGHIDPHGHQA